MGLDSREIIFLIGYLLFGIHLILRRIMFKTKSEIKAGACLVACLLTGIASIHMMLNLFI